ncbi:MAG: glycosyltransferase family 4 protein, partial [Patescibacteria group bacterium]
MRIFFVSRGRHPTDGGIERQNFELSHALVESGEVIRIRNFFGRLLLPIFFIYSFFFLLCRMKRGDVLLLGDAVLAPLAAAVRFFHPASRAVCIVHGLDVLFAKRRGMVPRVYRTVMLPSLKRCHLLIAVSHATNDIIREMKVSVPTEIIPNGINDAWHDPSISRRDLEQLLGRQLGDRKIILKTGRYVARKGSVWFLEHVAPSLPDDAFIVFAGAHRVMGGTGDADEYEACKHVITEKHWGDKVVLLTNVSDEALRVLYNTADIYIMPNISVPGTIEGFGITALEAASCGVPVVASRLEGITDAVSESGGGTLVPAGDSEAWSNTLRALLADGDRRKRLGSEA